MTTRNRIETEQTPSIGEIAALFPTGSLSEEFPPLLSFSQMAKLIGISPSTLSLWVSQGVFEKTTVKRGKRRFFLRDRAIRCLFSNSSHTSN